MMVVLDQLIEISTLDIFQVKPNVTRFVTYLLAREGLTHVLTNTATNAWLGMAFLYWRQHLSNALVAHGIVSTKQKFMLVQLRHNEHARTFVQRTMLRGILHAKDPIFVDEQKIFFSVCDSTSARPPEKNYDRWVLVPPTFLRLTHAHQGFAPKAVR